MDERSPLDNRSLTHTSREAEGQAWAQIGTKATTPKTTPAAKATTTPSNPPLPSSDFETPKPTPRDEDAMSDEGRPLQVVEDAEPEASNSQEEIKEGGESASGSKDDGKSRDRTNSNNPWMIRSRVFIGHLNTEKCMQKEVKELFAPFGKVIGCSLQHGYGFIQYEDEQAAKRAIKELHGLQFKGMKLVVDKTAALKKMLGENPNAPKPWKTESDEGRYRSEEVELRRREAQMYERYARLEELERMYFDRYPPMPPPPPRDPYFDRYIERPLPPRDPYMDRYRQAAEMERGRGYHERPPMGPSAATSFERAYYDSRDRAYERPRDDPYDRREKDAFRDHPLRDREPFERFDSSRRL